MPQIAYVNGQYLPRCHGAVSIEDRGYQFSDGVYQVMALINGALIDEQEHVEALYASLEQLRIPKPMEMGPLKAILKRLIALNRVRNAHIYIQVTRGIQKRDPLYKKDLQASLVVVVTPATFQNIGVKVPEIKVATVEDSRPFVGMKTLMRLPNVMSVHQAVDQGAQDAWMVKDGIVTEGSSSNAWIVNQSGQLQTHPPNGAILNGITRQALIKLATRHGLEVLEKPFTPAQAKKAQEAFMTASFSLIKAVTEIDQTPIGGGKVGPVTKELSKIYGKYINGKST